MSGPELSRAIENAIDIPRVLREAAPKWDGGYVICGVTGSGDIFHYQRATRIQLTHLDPLHIEHSLDHRTLRCQHHNFIVSIIKMIEGMEEILEREKADEILRLSSDGALTPDALRVTHLRRGTDHHYLSRMQTIQHPYNRLSQSGTGAGRCFRLFPIRLKWLLSA